MRVPGEAPALWVCTRGGLAKFSQGIWTQLTPKEGFPGIDTNDVAYTRDDDGEFVLWAGIWQVGLARFKRGHWELVPVKTANGSAFPVCLGTTIGPDKEPVLWLGTFDGGLAWLRKGQWRVIDGSQGLASNGIYTIYPMGQGKPTLLLGTRGGGIQTLDLGGWSMVDTALGLPGSEATAFLETQTPSGATETWVGTNQGLVRWSGTRWEPLNWNANGRRDFINALAETGTGPNRTLWVATLRGLAHRNGLTWGWEDTRTGLPNNFVLCLLQGHPEAGRPQLWAGTQGGLAYLQNGKWGLITTREGLPHDWVYSLLETKDPDGEWSLWVGTRGGGVGRLKGGHWSSPNQGLEQANLSVYCLREVVSQDGRRWLYASTVGRGLARISLEIENAPWELFTPSNLPGLPGKVILRLEELGGRLYATTSRGVTRITLSPGGVPTQAETYTTGDGLPSISCTPTASYIDSNQRLWVGTQQGAAILDAEQESPPPKARDPIIDGLAIKDVPQAVSLDRDLDPSENQLTILLASPGFHRWDDTTFQTQLVGAETTPGPWEPEPIRRYSALLPGRYEFKVWAQDAKGRISGPAVMAFRIRPPFWATAWAKGLYLLATFGLGAGILRLKTQRLQKRNEALSQSIDAATQGLQQQQRDLESLNQQLRTVNADKDQFLSIVSHDLRNPLTALALHAERLGLGDPTPEELQSTSAAMLRTTAHMAGLLTRLLNLNALESGRMTMEMIPLDLRDIARLTAESQGAPAQQKGITLKLDLADSPVEVLADPIHLEEAVDNLVSNAIKFSPKIPGSSVTIRVRALAGQGLLEVVDQGPGFTESDKARVFTRFARLSAQPTGGETSSGLGLSIVQRLMQEMGGRVEWDSQLGEGARFILRLPLTEAGPGGQT